MGGIPISTKGFKRELFHLFITIQDSPGSISRLVGLLAEEGFDIRDIELVRIRVGEAGTLRISFDSQNTASKAGRFLMKSGYSCRTQYEYRDFYY
jgi:prephenate dehydrogenase